MNHIVVSCYPAKSHFRSIIHILHTIVEHWNCKITIISSNFLRNYVEQHGFLFIEIKTPLFGVGFEDLYGLEKKRNNYIHIYLKDNEKSEIF